MNGKSRNINTHQSSNLSPLLISLKRSTVAQIESAHTKTKIKLKAVIDISLYYVLSTVALSHLLFFKANG